MLERRGLPWGNSPDLLSGGKTRANHIYALNVADGTLNGARLLVYLPEDDAGERALSGLSEYQDAGKKPLYRAAALAR